MTRSEFSDLVADIVQAEESRTMEKLRSLVASKPERLEYDLIFESFVQTADIAARVTVSILEQAGLANFDDEPSNPQ